MSRTWLLIVSIMCAVLIAGEGWIVGRQAWIVRQTLADDRQMLADDKELKQHQLDDLEQIAKLRQENKRLNDALYVLIQRLDKVDLRMIEKIPCRAPNTPLNCEPGKPRG